MYDVYSIPYVYYKQVRSTNKKQYRPAIGSSSFLVLSVKSHDIWTMNQLSPNLSLWLSSAVWLFSFVSHKRLHLTRGHIYKHVGLFP